MKEFSFSLLLILMFVSLTPPRVQAQEDELETESSFFNEETSPAEAQPPTVTQPPSAESAESKPSPGDGDSAEEQELDKETRDKTAAPTDTPIESLQEDSDPVDADAEEDIAELPEEAPEPPNITDKSDLYDTEPRRIHHPHAKKGLTRITKDKVYIYRRKTSPQDRNSSFRVGMYEPTELQNPDSPYTLFSDIYENPSQPLLLYDYEWLISRGALGQLGWKLGTGLYVATGNGVLESTGLPAREKFTFFAFPHNIAAIYRPQFWDTQVLVPFVEGGFDVFTFAEIRDDDKGPKFGASPAAHVAAGGSLSLEFISQSALATLDQEYGINSVYLTLEYRVYIALKKDYDFSSQVINGGIGVAF